MARRNALYTTISTPGDKRPQHEHRLTDAVLRVVQRGEVGERPHLALEHPHGGETWHIKGNDVTNVEWEPEMRVLSFNLTRQAQRSIVNQN